MSERTDTLSRRLVSKREARDKAKAEYEVLKDEYREVEQAIWEYMDDQGMTTMTLDLGTGYGKVQFQKRETIRGIIKDPEKAAETLTEMGLDDALLGARSVRQKALSEHVRDWLAAGQKIPEGLDFNPTRYVSISRK